MVAGPYITYFKTPASSAFRARHTHFTAATFGSANLESTNRLFTTSVFRASFSEVSIDIDVGTVIVVVAFSTYDLIDSSL